MDKTSTLIDAIQFVYQEMPAEESKAFELEMILNQAVAEETAEIENLKHAIGNQCFNAPKSILKNLHDFTRAYEAIEMPDETHTDMILN